MDVKDTGVDPWTLRWWESLPSNYRLIDAAQVSPAGLHQVGFNADPLFLEGFDGWEVRALEQGRETATVEFRRTFFQSEAAGQVAFQVWPREVTEGSVLSMSLTDGGSQVLARQVFDAATGNVYPNDLTIQSEGTPFLPLTASFVIRVRYDAGPLMYGIRAVNIGAKRVPYAALPNVFEGFTHPLLRYMNGIGAVAGDFRAASDALWGGMYSDPLRVPDNALRWFAQLMGVGEAQRSIPDRELREYLVDLVANGTPAIGNKRSIATAAKRFLAGDRQVSVIPGNRTHQIIVLVREDQLASGGTDALLAGIRSTGVVPAGHELVARVGGATWDEYEAALADTWAEADKQQPNWSAADSVGVNPEGGTPPVLPPEPSGFGTSFGTNFGG